MSRANRITAPLANKTQYVVNARFDVMNQRRFRDCATNGGDDCCGPKLTGGDTSEIFNINEHELVFRLTSAEGGCCMYSDGRNYVFSALNGCCDGEKIALAGIAQGSSSGIDDRMHLQGLAIQREGVNTIINTSRDKINPGDTLYWKLPSNGDERNDYAQNIAGVPKQKRCAVITKTAPTTAEPYKRRVGMALSAAAEGQPLDILFQPGY